MKNIAIIGTGIAGMGLAYCLQQDPARRFNITVYEKNNYIGGHTRTKNIIYDGQRVAVDTGFIVFNDRNYPHLCGLFEKLGVPSIASSMSFAVSVGHGRLEWGARDLNAIFGQRSNLLSPRFYRMIADVRRFFREAPALLTHSTDQTLGDYLAAHQYSEDFAANFLLPMGGAIWSCPLDVMMLFPAHTFVRFFHNHGLLTFNDQPQWRTVQGGAAEYVKRLTAIFADKIKLNCGAAQVTRHENGVSVTDTHGQTQNFDEVIFACHADQTLRLLGDATADEKAVLGGFRYQPNRAYLHRDIRQMPKRRACWGSWAYLSDGETNGDKLAVTYWMNNLQSIDERMPLFVTLNPITPIPDHLVFDVGEFEHPVFDQTAVAAQQKIPSIQGQHKAWFCGAYQRYGFHEDGLLSAVKVAEQMGVPIPWL